MAISTTVTVSSKVSKGAHARLQARSDQTQDYYTTHPPFNSSSQVAVAAVGTVGLGIQYGEVSFVLVRLSSSCLLTHQVHRFSSCLSCSAVTQNI